MQSPDTRLLATDWDPAPTHGRSRRIALIGATHTCLSLWYFAWLLQPVRVGNALLYVLLVLAEAFNLIQAVGFWWTCAHHREEFPLVLAPSSRPEVDVLVPVYDEPVEVVEPTLVAAARMNGARVNVYLLDDGYRSEMQALAEAYGLGYIRRANRTGAKAGNINHALSLTGAPFVAVFDCDHVPDERFLERTLAHFSEDDVAFVQTPQYYANASSGAIPAAAWAQQALFFGPIASGKHAMGTMFCCGTNMVFRRDALESAGGFPAASLTEDFELSVLLHEGGWRSVYVPEVLAKGLGPEDMASYVGQQSRWARGCLGAIPRVLKARLPLHLRVQYLLSSMYFMSGWTALIYMCLPVIRILTGAQPLDSATADQFLLHFAPYFGMSLLAVSTAGAGSYTFSAFALAFANFWIHVHASVVTLLRRPGSFKVTPKRGADAPQPRAAAPALVVAALLGAVGVYGLTRALDPANLNNVAFLALHVSVLATGVRGALVRRRSAGTGAEGPEARRAA